MTTDTDSSRALAMIERMATDPACEPAKLRELLAVKQTWEADEARKAFARDMAKFQSECPIISKGDSANGKMYARIDRIHRETRALRKECGFWFTWSECEIRDGIAHMAGLLGHSGGHTVPIKQVLPLPEELRGTNQAQRAGSAMTYAKRYGECLALDIVTGEDTDANTSRPVGPSAMQPSDNALKALAAELWNVLAPVRGTEKNWNAANQWLWKQDILDSGADERAPQLTVERFRKVIAQAKENLTNGR